VTESATNYTLAMSSQQADTPYDEASEMFSFMDLNNNNNKLELWSSGM
jgi:hypothetical protein